MIDTLKKEWQAQISLLLFGILTVWWFISPSFKPSPDARFLGDFGSIYVILAFLGALWGMVIAKKWGGYKSIMGKAILFFSLGLMAQVFGQVTYAYFSFVLHVVVPYPSLGDLGYFGSIPIYILGVYYLAKASGVNITLRLFRKKLQAIIVPAGMLFTGYYLFLRTYEFDWSNPVKIFLDFGYPLGQAFYVSLAFLAYLLTRGVLGGIMKSKVLFILGALCMQFLSDYVFLYQSSQGTWSVGGVNDYMYLIAYFTMTLGLLQLKTVYDHLRST